MFALIANDGVQAISVWKKYVKEIDNWTLQALREAVRNALILAEANLRCQQSELYKKSYSSSDTITTDEENEKEQSISIFQTSLELQSACSTVNLSSSPQKLNTQKEQKIYGSVIMFEPCLNDITTAVREAVSEIVQIVDVIERLEDTLPKCIQDYLKITDRILTMPSSSLSNKNTQSMRFVVMLSNDEGIATGSQEGILPYLSVISTTLTTLSIGASKYKSAFEGHLSWLWEQDPHVKFFFIVYCLFFYITYITTTFSTMSTNFFLFLSFFLSSFSFEDANEKVCK